MFVTQMAKFFEEKDRSDHLHETDQLIAANDELKLSLLRLSMIYDIKLSEVEKEILNSLGLGSVK